MVCSFPNMMACSDGIIDCPELDPQGTSSPAPGAAQDIPRILSCVDVMDPIIPESVVQMLPKL